MNNERWVSVPADEYSALIELKGRVNATLIYIDKSEFIDKGIVKDILRGRSDND